MATSNGYGSDQNSDTSTTDESDTSIDNNNPTLNDTLKKMQDKMKFIKKSSRHFWDPLESYDWDQTGPPGPLASARIRRDISSIFKEPLTGICAVPEENNMSLVHCLLLGTEETPYDGGFFHFIVRFGPSYPMHPPRVRLITTDRGKVRFNPNLYRCGRVCLSILGTWSGPAWSPASNLSSLLLSIQSIMNEKPYFNEPGFSKEQYVGQSDQYNLYLTHETLRVAVCDKMDAILFGQNPEKIPMPKDLHNFMKPAFLEYYDQYIDTCTRNKEMDGKPMKDAFGEVNKNFDFTSIEARIKKIKVALCKEGSTDEAYATSDSNESPPSSLSSSDTDHLDATPSGSHSDPKSAAILSEANEYGITEDDDLSSLKNTLNSTQEGDDWLLQDDSNDDETEGEVE